MDEAKAIVRYAGDELFIGISPSGHAQVLDTNHERASAATPVELLLIALGSCTAVDVVSMTVSKSIMRRILIWILIGSYTFVLGVAATPLWIQLLRPAAKIEVSAPSAQPAGHDTSKDLPILDYCKQ